MDAASPLLLGGYYRLDRRRRKLPCDKWLSGGQSPGSCMLQSPRARQRTEMNDCSAMRGGDFVLGRAMCRRNLPAVLQDFESMSTLLSARPGWYAFSRGLLVPLLMAWPGQVSSCKASFGMLHPLPSYRFSATRGRIRLQAALAFSIQTPPWAGPRLIVQSWAARHLVIAALITRLRLLRTAGPGYSVSVSRSSDLAGLSEFGTGVFGKGRSYSFQRMLWAWGFSSRQNGQTRAPVEFPTDARAR